MLGDRPLAEQRLVERNAEAELVGAGIGRLPPKLLWSHVRGVPISAPVFVIRVIPAGPGRPAPASDAVPISPLAVSVAAPEIRRANPKSVTRTDPSRPIMTFWGLKSR